MEQQAVIQRSGGEHKGFFSLFSIKPYKNRLLTPGASYWIACAHLVVFVMAMSEAIAWGYLGSLFGKGIVGYVAAAIAFLFMFAIIWVIDVSFVTMDLSRSYYDRAILKQDTEKWQDRARMGIGLLGRVVIVIVSLTISAPFLSQIVFKQDIDNEMHRRNLASVSAARDSILAEKSGEIAGLDSLILAREADLIQETAGRGTSGNYGIGPVTLTMEKNLQRLREERGQLVQERAQLENTLKSTSIEDLAGQYNVDLIDNGVQVRETILGGLMENPQYRTAKSAVTAFLAFIFGALVLLKLFQPRSVRIYYNEKLQDLYREYLDGNLNRWIARQEQSTEGGTSHMSPLRFEDWCINTYSVVRSEDIKRRDSRKIYNLFKMKIEQLEEEKSEIKRMLEPIESEYDEVMKEVSEIKIDLLQADSDIAQGARNEEDLAGQLASIDDDLSNSRFRGSDVLIAVTAKKDLEERRAAQKSDAIALQHRRNLILHKLDVKESEAKEIEGLIEKIRANYRNIQDKIDTERLAYTDLIVSGQIIDFPRGTKEDEMDVQEGDEQSTESPAQAEEKARPLWQIMAERLPREPRLGDASPTSTDTIGSPSEPDTNLALEETDDRPDDHHQNDRIDETDRLDDADVRADHEEVAAKDEETLFVSTEDRTGTKSEAPAWNGDEAEIEWEDETPDTAEIEESEDEMDVHDEPVEFPGNEMSEHLAEVPDGYRDDIPEQRFEESAEPKYSRFDWVKDAVEESGFDDDPDKTINRRIVPLSPQSGLPRNLFEEYKDPWAAPRKYGFYDEEGSMSFEDDEAYEDDDLDEEALAAEALEEDEDFEDVEEDEPGIEFDEEISYSNESEEESENSEDEDEPAEPGAVRTPSDAEIIEEFLRRRDNEAFVRRDKGLRKGAFGKTFGEGV